MSSHTASTATAPPRATKRTSLMVLPNHVSTQHVFGFLDLVSLIRLSATCRKWYAVRRDLLRKRVDAERATWGSRENSLFTNSLRYWFVFWCSVCPQRLVVPIFDRYGEEYPTDVLEAMVMSGRKKTYPWMDDYHPLVVRDVMLVMNQEWMCIRALLDAATAQYKELGLLDEPYHDVFFANRMVSTDAERDAFKGKWEVALLEIGRRLYELELRLQLAVDDNDGIDDALPAAPLPVLQ